MRATVSLADAAADAHLAASVLNRHLTSLHEGARRRAWACAFLSCASARERLCPGRPGGQGVHHHERVRRVGAALLTGAPLRPRTPPIEAHSLSSLVRGSAERRLTYKLSLSPTFQGPLQRPPNTHPILPPKPCSRTVVVICSAA
eukprot:4737976-Pleurochrysis_carterae.AAC.1